MQYARINSVDGPIAFLLSGVQGMSQRGNTFYVECFHKTYTARFDTEAECTRIFDKLLACLRRPGLEAVDDMDIVSRRREPVGSGGRESSSGNLAMGDMMGSGLPGGYDLNISTPQ